MDPQQQQAQAQEIFRHIGMLMPIFLLFGIVIVALYVIPMWKIATKAGLSGPIALLAIIPIVGKLVTLYVLAFSEWRVVPAPPQYGGYPPSYTPPPPYTPPPTYTPPPPAA